MRGPCGSFPAPAVQFQMPEKGSLMIAVALYAEVYLICFIVVALLLRWARQTDTDSTQERWLRRVFASFMFSFGANFLFTLFNGARLLPGLFPYASYIFKSLYHISMCVGVYAWCGYSAALRHAPMFQSVRARRLSLLFLAPPVAGILLNFKTRLLFEITPEGGYVRHAQFHAQMLYLAAVSLFFSVPLLKHMAREFEPTRRGHLRLTAAFTLCILLAWALSFVGESIPVICVVFMLELLCLYVVNSNQQISMDKLTQVNNRQNLLNFLEYKLINHEESLYLLMLDVDYFKDINDTYGHLEGDEALTEVAGVLKRACADYPRRPYIARYGGDEFIILLEGGKADAESLRASIHQSMAELTRRLGKPYALTLSIGIGRWHPDMDVKAFIAAADAELYEIKRARTKRG